MTNFIKLETESLLFFLLITMNKLSAFFGFFFPLKWKHSVISHLKRTAKILPDILFKTKTD